MKDVKINSVGTKYGNTFRRFENNKLNEALVITKSSYNKSFVIYFTDDLEIVFLQELLKQSLPEKGSGIYLPDEDGVHHHICQL
jgi:hypothetical protein